MKYYAGVGSRSTPPLIQDVMTAIAGVLASEGWILRSGGADGADKAFEKGVTDRRLKEIYIPWMGFNNRVFHSHSDILLDNPETYEIAKSVHPAWHRMKNGSRKLHARNVHQILGKDLNTPSKFVICWTLGGLLKGGTRTAIVLAQQHEIPVYNLGKSDPSDMVPVKKWVDDILKLTEA